MKQMISLGLLGFGVALVGMGCEDNANSESGGINENGRQRDAGEGIRIDFDVLDALPALSRDAGPPFISDGTTLRSDAQRAPARDRGMEPDPEDAAGEPMCRLGERRCNMDGAVEVCGDADGTGRVQWLRPMFCPLGQMCQAGECVGEMPEGCRDVCEAGAARCSGPLIERCANGADGCLTWMQPAPCPEGSQCQRGLCQPPDGCVNECNEGRNLCDGDLIRECRLGPEGCWILSDPVPCVDGLSCRLNQCRCEGECLVGQRSCVEEGLQTCAAVDGCGQWQDPVPCAEGQICANGFCQRAPCEHECIALGQRDCVGDLQRRCEFDENLCRVWAEPMACEGGRVCRENGCVFECDNECDFVGTARCEGAVAIHTCTRDPVTQCLAWAFLADCGPGQICRDGRCFRAP